MRRLLIIAAVSLVLPAWSCEAPPLPPPADAAGEASPDDCDPAAVGPLLEVGGADELGNGFVDWSAGDAVPDVIYGIQGGQHIWVSVRVRKTPACLSPKKMRLGVQAKIIDSGKVVKPGRVQVTHNLLNADPDSEWYVYEGIPSFVTCPCQITGRKLEMRVDLSDLYGQEAAATAVITPYWDETAHDCSGAVPTKCLEQ